MNGSATGVAGVVGGCSKDKYNEFAGAPLPIPGNGNENSNTGAGRLQLSPMNLLMAPDDVILEPRSQGELPVVYFSEAVKNILEAMD